MQSTYQGDRKAKKLLDTLKEPFAVAPDYSALIVVIGDRPVFYPDDNMQSDGEGIGDKHRAEIYRCSESGLSWTFIPIPIRFTVREVKYEHGRFCFVSIDGKTIAGTPDQICKGMREVILNLNWATSEEIENSFLSIPSIMAPLI